MMTGVRRTNKTNKIATLCDLQLPLGVTQSGEQVQLDPGLSAQAVLQVLSLLLHGRQRRHQDLRVLLVLLVLPQLLHETRGGERDGIRGELSA